MSRPASAAQANAGGLAWISHNAAALARLGVLRPALRVALIEQWLAEAANPIHSTEQRGPLAEQFWRQQRIPPKRRNSWLQQRGVGPTDLALLVSRRQRWSQWCQQQWGQKLEALFLKHKNQLDRASGFFLELEDPGLAREFYLQLSEGEASFNDLHRRHCQEHPQRRGGRIGPTALSALPPALADLIRSSPPKTVREPLLIAPRRWAIVLVEQFQSARLDDPAIPEQLLELEGEAELKPRIENWFKGQEIKKSSAGSGNSSGEVELYRLDAQLGLLP